jgi:hypothetical protein
MAPFLGIAFLFSIEAAAETFPLTMKFLGPKPESRQRLEDADFLYRMTYSQSYWQQRDQQVRRGEGPFYEEIVKKEPAFHLEKPFKNVAQLGSVRFPFAFDSTDLARGGFDILYWDSNRNGDLTDETPIKAEPIREGDYYADSYIRRNFPPLTFPVEIENATFEYACTFGIHCQFDSRTHQLLYMSASLQSGCYREGEIVAGGKKHRLVVLDFNSDGRFDNRAQSVQYRSGPNAPEYIGISDGDMLLIDPDLKNTESFSYDSIGRDDRQPLARLLPIEGKFYELKVSPSGDTVTLTPYTGEMGLLSNPNPKFRALVVHPELGVVKATGGAQQGAPVPAGTWKMVEYVIAIPPSEGAGGSTYIQANAPGNYPEVEVRAGKIAKLPFGPPYHGETYLGRVRNENQGRMASLQMQLMGSMGETCNNVVIDGKRPEPPSFVIATSRGKIVERGQFEYG